MSSRRVSEPAATALFAEQPPSQAAQVLAQAQSGRTVIQDFCPLADSLEWQLGQDYLRDRGSKAFISDYSPVPYVVNNDGTLSYHAADVFYTSLVEAEKAGELAPDEDIFVLELGIGVGLFARFFLDAFRDLCWKHDKDYYDRFTYIAADRSERMLMDLCRHGLLFHHPGRWCVRRVDAMKPGEFLPRDARFARQKGKPLRAVFLNYLLDCLPAAVLEIGEDEVKQLHVRTVVARNINLKDHTDLTAGQLQERAKSNDPQARQDLLEVYGLFASEYDYRPVDVKTLPHGEWAVERARGWTPRLLHSYGALQSLDQLMALVQDTGFILINDYGSAEMQMSEHFEHQRFSLGTFVGLNFALLGEYYSQENNSLLMEPFGEAGGIHSRLLGHRPTDVTILRFCKLFGSFEYERLQRPVQKARQWLQYGRFEMATSEYQEAIETQPYNWVLLNEVAMFLIFQKRDLKAGIDMVRLALAQNPTCSAELWSTLGDGLFEFGRYTEAKSVYREALRVNDQDVRARFNLAFVHLKEKDHAAALQRIAEAFALDKTGQYRDRLLQKLQETLARLTEQHRQEYLLLINLVSTYTPSQPTAAPGAIGNNGQSSSETN